MPKTTFEGKLLSANRSEIAIRSFRAANELGIRTTAIFAEEDRFSRHRFKADEAYQLDITKGPVGAYLDYEGIVKLAKEKGVTLVHPGYGFLSENADFARLCEENGIKFIGPTPDQLANMGDKTAARQMAINANVPVLPGTEDAIASKEEALEVSKEVGFPLIIKAAHGGGGRGMRVVHEEAMLDQMFDEASQEAEKAFGNGEVFIERFIGRAKHIEVQILGDQHGNIVHLYERDCSIQRRHQKVVEVAPAVGVDPQIREDLCEAAVRLAKSINYQNAGTVEFLYDMDQKDWFFIEMNPRIQVEHTITECITGIDLVRSQILVAMGYRLDSPEINIMSQDDIQVNGAAIQCRITTEDPANGFAPDYGKILNYRSAAGFGIRLDAGSGDAGSVITPFYDSMLVKLTGFARDYETACNRVARALREFRIRGVKTNIPFIENVIDNEDFRSGQATTRLIDTTPSLFEFKEKRDRATKMLSYLSDVIVNGNETTKGWKPEKTLPVPQVPVSTKEIEKGSRDLLLELGPDKFSQWIKDEQRLLVTDTTFRDAHQSLMATRMRTVDMLNIADTIARETPKLFSMEMWGGATFDTSMRFLKECPWERLAQLRERVPNILFQMLFRGSNAVGYTNYPDNVVAGFLKHAADSGIDLFRIFDSLNYLPNMKVAMEAIREHGKVLCEATICYTGNIEDPNKAKYDLKYYVEKAKELEKMGAHIIAIKDMAGLCRPNAAKKLVSTLKQEIGLPIHFHTHDTSGINSSSILSAAEAGVDIADMAISSMSGSTSQPNLNSIVAALEFDERATGLNLNALNDIAYYWEDVCAAYTPFITAPRSGTAEVYEHEMPGGQYTNLKEQGRAMGLGPRWREIAHTYADVNNLFGDITKVTPSSKVVGDMAMFLTTKGIKPEDVTSLDPGAVDWPQSVVGFLKGDLGQPEDGFPEDLQNVILNGKEATTKRPGELAAPVDLEETREQIKAIINREVTNDDLYSYLMYPEVFQDFQISLQTYDKLSPLPTPAFFYGLNIGQEVSVEIGPGKTLFIKLISIGEPNQNGQRTVFYELNGMPRESVVTDKNFASTGAVTQKGNPNDPAQACAPMPGLVTELNVKVGDSIKEGEALLTLEAMKMLTTVSASKDGTIKAIHTGSGQSVDTNDLLVEID